MKKPIIDEESVDYIRKNNDILAVKNPNKILVFSLGEILGRFNTQKQVDDFVESKDLTLFVIWKFNKLPERVVAGIMYDHAKNEKERKEEINRQRSRRFYKRNRKQILLKQKERDPRKTSRCYRKWYYRDQAETLRKKKLQKLGLSKRKYL